MNDIVKNIVKIGRLYNKYVIEANEKIYEYRAGKISEGDAWEYCHKRDDLKNKLLDIISHLGVE